MKLLINNKKYEFFTGYTISLAYNSVASSFSFPALKEITNSPTDYPSCKVLDDDDNLLITGTVVNQEFVLSAKPTLNQYSGYSLPGIIEDCPIPIDLYPLQSDNLSLKQITDKLLKPFNLSYVVSGGIDSDFNKKFVKSTASATQSIKSYLQQLASQRDIMISHNKKGQIVFTRLDVSKIKPVAVFEDGKHGIDFRMSVNGQGLHSKITVVKQASTDNPDAAQYTITNPYGNIYRPKVVILSSGDVFDVKKAARNELSAELQNIKFTFTSKVFYNVGDVIQLSSAKFNINKLINLFIDTVLIKGSQSGEIYSYSLSLPDVYGDNEVKNIFE